MINKVIGIIWSCCGCVLALRVIFSTMRKTQDGQTIKDLFSFSVGVGLALLVDVVLLVTSL